MTGIPSPAASSGSPGKEKSKKEKKAEAKVKDQSAKETAKAAELRKALVLGEGETLAVFTFESGAMGMKFDGLVNEGV